MRRRIEHRRGLTTVLAVGLIALVSSAVVALTATLDHDRDRTIRARREAQLRQLLLAGERAAPALLDRLAANGRSEESAKQQPHASIPLPRSLTKHGARLQLERRNPPSKRGWTVEVRAELDGHVTQQILRYARREGAWQLLSARLSRHPAERGQQQRAFRDRH